jgi:uncharacterized protein (DUF1499 family)
VTEGVRSVRLKRLIQFSFVLIFSVCIGLGLLSMFSQRPSNLGVSNGTLAECPASPNCVSSQTKLADHRMPPIPFAGKRGPALTKLKKVVAELFPRARLVKESEGYLHYEFTSLLFRFVDDVEFLADDESQQIHFRSASRVGHSDLGANRRRITKISKEFQQ